MDEKTREKIISSFEDAMRSVGAQSYEEGMETVVRFFRVMGNHLEAMRTPDQLRKGLDSLPTLSARDKVIFLFAMSHLPQLMRLGLKWLGKEAVRTLPALNAGRPRSMGSSQSEEVLDYISKLQRQGTSLKAAKLRAAVKYRCSPRTIERYWATRGEPAEDAPNLDEIVRFFSENQ